MFFVALPPANTVMWKRCTPWCRLQAAYLDAELSGALRVVPDPPHAIVVISVAVSNVQLSAHLFLCTIYLRGKQQRNCVILPNAVVTHGNKSLPVPTSQSGVFSWWMTTFTCLLRAKATIASLPANVPGWERLDTGWKDTKKTFTVLSAKNLTCILIFQQIWNKS